MKVWNPPLSTATVPLTTGASLVPLTIAFASTRPVRPRSIIASFSIWAMSTLRTWIRKPSAAAGALSANAPSTSTDWSPLTSFTFCISTRSFPYRIAAALPGAVRHSTPWVRSASDGR